LAVHAGEAVVVLEVKGASGVMKQAKIMSRQDFDVVQVVIQMTDFAMLSGVLGMEQEVAMAEGVHM
jgi:hypothetical protein